MRDTTERVREAVVTAGTAQLVGSGSGQAAEIVFEGRRMRSLADKTEDWL